MGKLQSLNLGNVEYIFIIIILWLILIWYGSTCKSLI